MAHEVLEKIEASAAYVREHAEEAEALGRLPDESAKRMKDAGVIRMLQPSSHGGYQSDPRDFFKAVMAYGQLCGASGWVAGIVGVHPWEMALCDPKVQDEVWGKDSDTWIASPYAPMGRAKPVEGGFIFNGRWSFSSGTDHCDWIFLGGMVVGKDGQPTDPPEIRHFILPRSDYEIIDDSWNVVGLRGTGSKDVVVKDAFIPEYRTIDAAKVLNGTAAKEAGREEPLYRMPWSAIFPNAITAAVIGICEGALAAHIDYQRDRVSAVGIRVGEDPHSLSAVGEAASEIHACRAQLLMNVGEMFERCESNQPIPLELRTGGRRDQVRGSWRAVQAVDKVFAYSGGGALRMDRPLQRLWRDAHAGLNHAINVSGPVYSAYAGEKMGQELTGWLRLTI